MEIAIIGAGKLGIKVTESLLSGNYSITLVDKDEDILNKIGNQLDVMPLNIDARDINALKRTNIKRRKLCGIRYNIQKVFLKNLWCIF